MNLFKKIKIRDVLLLFIGIILGIIVIASLVGAKSIIGREALVALLAMIIGAFIPSIFQNWTARLDRKNQLRLAALDRRLDVHQKAYSLWVELRSKVHHSDEIWEYVIECQKWWNENCLYLSPEARKAFKHAYMCASNHKDLLNERKIVIDNSQNNKQRLAELNELITRNWEEILEAGKAIIEGVELPTIGEEELKSVDSKKEKD